MSLSHGYAGCFMFNRARLSSQMNDAHQTPVEEAISFLTIAAILVAVGCYAAAAQNIPVASPALFWVASTVYHWFPGLNDIRAPQMPMLVSAAAVGGTFFVVGIPFAGLLARGFQARKSQTWSGKRRSCRVTEPGFKSSGGTAIAMTFDRFYQS
jgi:hypothetical protein